jgi:hypothetical protein
MAFTPIDRNNPPKAGMFWIAGNLPDGQLHVALCWTQPCDEQGIEIETIDMARLKDTPPGFEPTMLCPLEYPTYPIASDVGKPNRFQLFNQSSPPPDGLYWVAGLCASAGRVAEGGARHTDSVAPFVSLVSLESSPELAPAQGVAFFALDKNKIGSVEERDCVEFYLPLVPPQHPDTPATPQANDHADQPEILSVLEVKRHRGRIETKLHFAVGQSSHEAAQRWFASYPAGPDVANEIYVSKAGKGTLVATPCAITESFNEYDFLHIIDSACPAAFVRYTRDSRSNHGGRTAPVTLP